MLVVKAECLKALAVYINDLDHLERVINRLERVEGVKTVMRYE
jgi:(p)ppGpp synthase/HD superfamily hydrolase